MRLPRMPERPRVERVSDTAVAVSWDVAPLSEGITHYDVGYNVQHSDGRLSHSQFEQDITAEAVLIDGLMPGKEYRFRVRAANGMGDGRYSPNTVIRMEA